MGHGDAGDVRYRLVTGAVQPVTAAVLGLGATVLAGRVLRRGIHGRVLLAVAPAMVLLSETARAADHLGIWAGLAGACAGLTAGFSAWLWSGREVWRPWLAAIGLAAVAVVLQYRLVSRGDVSNLGSTVVAIGLLCAVSLVGPLCAALKGKLPAAAPDWVMDGIHRYAVRPLIGALVASALIGLWAAPRLPGRFLLLMIVIAGWARLVDTAPSGSGPFRRELVTAGFGLVLVAPLVVTDLGLGIAAATALAGTAAAFVPRARSMWLIAGCGAVGAGVAAFFNGWLPLHAGDRLLAAVNWSFGVGADQLASARAGMVAGSWWGLDPTATAPLVPEAEADMIGAMLAREFGVLGLAGAMVLVGALLAGLIGVAGAANFGSDRDRSRLRFAWVIGAGLTFAALTSLNVCGSLGIVPLTGVPVPFLSRSGDAAAALLVALIVVSRHRISTVMPEAPRRDVRVMGAAVVILVALPVVWALAWVAASAGFRSQDPERWYVMHHLPLTGVLASFERTVDEKGIPVFWCAQPGGDPVSLSPGEVVELAGMRWRVSRSQWAPTLEMAGWSSGSRDVPVGRIVYQDHLWWLVQRRPEFNLWWDDLADLNAGRFRKSVNGWIYEPSSTPYRGVQYRHPEAPGWTPATSAVPIPSLHAPVHFRFGRTVVSVTVDKSARLAVDLSEPLVTLPLVKDGRTVLAGARGVRDPRYRPRLTEDHRVGSAFRLAAERGWLNRLPDGSVVFQAPESDRLSRSVARDLKPRGRRNAKGIVFEDDDFITLPDGRPAALSARFVRWIGPGDDQSELRLADRNWSRLEPFEVGLGPLWGTAGGGASPGFAALAPAFVGDTGDPTLKLTIDGTIQLAATRALQGWAEDWRQRTKPGDPALVAGALVVDGKNRVLAIASTPMVQSEDELLKRLDAGRYDPATRPLVFDQVPAGSTLKVAVWAGLLEQAKRFFFERGEHLFVRTWKAPGGGGRIPEDFRCRGVVTNWLGRRIPAVHNSGRRAFGVVPFETHLAVSSNTALVAPLAAMDSTAFQEFVNHIGELGLLRQIDLLPAELRDPMKPWEPHLWWQGRNAALEPVRPEAFGASDNPASGTSLASRVRFHLGGFSIVSGLNLAATLNTVVGGGVYRAPQLVTGVRLGDGTEHHWIEPAPERVLDRGVADRLARALGAVPRTTESGHRGTAAEVFAGSRLLENEYHLVAKTGTHQHASPRPADGVFLASTVVPLTGERLTVFVFGRGVAGPGLDPKGAQRVARGLLETLTGDSAGNQPLHPPP